MSEAKEIPKEILEAATKAAIAAGFPGEHDLNAAKKDSGRRMAQAALEAAGIPAMAERVTGAEQIIASRQLELNQARERIAELEAELARKAQEAANDY